MLLRTVQNDDTFAFVKFPGRKALKKTLQLCQDAEQMLSMYHLHVMCRTSLHLRRSAGLQLANAQRKLNFHVETAIDKGEASDRPIWASIALWAQGIQLQADEVTSELVVNAKTALTSEESQLWLDKASARRHQAALQGLLQDVASAPTRPAVCTQHSASAGHEESIAGSLQHHGAQASPPSAASPVAISATGIAAASPADILKPAGAAAPAATTASQPSSRGASQADVKHSSASKGTFADQSTSGPFPADDPDAAGRSHNPAQEGPNACRQTIPLPKCLTEPPNLQKVVPQLLALGLPGFENKHPAECLLACEGPLTAPQPAFSPFQIRGSYSARLDPNLIIWNPGDSSAAWIDPDFHLNATALADIIPHYSSAKVLIEDDCDSDGKPANPKYHQSLLAELNIDSLPSFAMAALNDIMAHQMRSDVERLTQDAAGPHSIPGARRAEPASDVWSRRLVYLRQLDPDRLLGCVQVCMQPAARDLVELVDLFLKLTLRCDRFPKPPFQAVWNGHARQSEVSVISENGQPATEPQPAALPPSQHPRIATVLETLMQTRNFRPRSANDETGAPTDTNPSRSGATHEGAGSERSKPQFLLRESPEPISKSSAASDTKALMPADDLEVAGKLREAQWQLEARYRLPGSSKADQEKFAKQRLQREKKDERNRKAWAKLGKEPPPPKAPKASVKASGSNAAGEALPAADDDDDEEADPEAEEQSCDEDESDREEEEEEQEDPQIEEAMLEAEAAAAHCGENLLKEQQRQRQVRERQEAQALANAAALLR